MVGEPDGPAANEAPAPANTEVGLPDRPESCAAEKSASITPQYCYWGDFIGRRKPAATNRTIRSPLLAVEMKGQWSPRTPSNYTVSPSP
jgi:hypothetical protein